jgi:hypothetical protein
MSAEVLWGFIETRPLLIFVRLFAEVMTKHHQKGTFVQQVQWLKDATCKITLCTRHTNV